MPLQQPSHDIEAKSRTFTHGFGREERIEDQSSSSLQEGVVLPFQYVSVTRKPVQEAES